MKFGKSDPRNRVTSERTDRAVSPVIGVILMVAITVILAAVIGVFVLGLGDELGDSAPTASLSADNLTESDDTFDLTHSSGDTLDTSDLTVLVDGTADNDAEIDADELAPGETTTVELDDDYDAGDEVEIRIRHDPSDSVILTEELEVVDDS